MEDRLTPDEMKAAGLDYVTPAEARGRDNGAGPRPPAPDLGEGPVHDPTNMERLFPGPNDPGGRPENWTNNPSESGDLITQGLMLEAGARASGAPFRAIAPARMSDPAGAARMASSAAYHGARAAAAGASTNTDLLLTIARLLGAHGHPVLHAAVKAVPTAIDSAAAGADAMMQGATAASHAAVSAQNAREESPEQRMARILMQGISQPEFK